MRNCTNTRTCTTAKRYKTNKAESKVFNVREEEEDYDNDMMTISSISKKKNNSNKNMSLQSLPFTAKNNVSSSFSTLSSKGYSSASSSNYRMILQNDVKRRTFPLSQILDREVINTGRTIKPLKAWKGHWPALREFLQNTIDHLHLMNGSSGRREQCLKIEVTNKNENEKSNKNNNILSITILCQEEAICKITVSNDKVVINQLYTYPISSRALDTGVPDSAKSSSSSQAGGFGDGFKTAAVALIANNNSKKKNDFQALKWYFYATQEKVKIEWDFVGLTRESVATFEECQVLQVKIKKECMKAKELNEIFNEYPVEMKDGKGFSGRDYIMRQVIQVKGIGKSFMEETIPRLVVFWNLNETSLTAMSARSTRASGGDFIAPVDLQHTIFDGASGKIIKPKSGVYVKGIYVRPSKIKDTIVCFFGDRLEVSGRDRNEVDEDELINAVTRLIGRCNNIDYLKELLLPLKGHCCTSKNDVQQSSKRSKTSWLLQSPRFFNQVIEIQKDFILYTVFNIPRGALFVSKKTTDSKDPFINWCATFLKKHGAPLVSISPGANRYLFQEVDSFDLIDRCVSILKGLDKANRNNSNESSKEIQSICSNFFAFMGIGRVKPYFHTEINVAFVHNFSIFIPKAPLT